MAYLRAKCNALIDIALQVEKENEQADLRLRHLTEEKEGLEKQVEGVKRHGLQEEADRRAIGLPEEIAIIYETPQLPVWIRTALSIICALASLLGICGVIVCIVALAL